MLGLRAELSSPERRAPIGHLSFARSRARRPIGGLICSAALLMLAACDGPPVAADVTAPQSERTVAVSLRLDSSPEVPASLTVLAFRAAVTGVPARDVLSLVDPLSSPAPERTCVLRDLDRLSAELENRGSSIELEELTGVSIGVAGGAAAGPWVRPAPRLYPDVTAVISGVVGEAGPVLLQSLPPRIRVMTTDSSLGLPQGAADEIDVDVPAAARLVGLNGLAPSAGIRVEARADLILTMADAEPATLELRPLGGTVALVCPLRPHPVVTSTSAGQTSIVSKNVLTALLARSGAAAGAPVAAALDFVRRSESRLPSSGGRVSVESRTSTLVELRP